MGLLLLRMVVFSYLIYDATAVPRPPQDLPRMLAAGAGVLLFLGLWTPAVGGIAAALEFWLAFSSARDFWLSLMVAMACLPTGFLTLLLAAIKLIGDRRR